MKELIKIVKTKGISTVNAKDLHLFLEISTRYDTWLSRRIKEYGFENGNDFIVVLKNEQKQPNGGRPATDCFLSIDMAKELSMVERNEQGKKARKYFIECENRLKEISVANVPENMKLPDFNDPVAAARAWADAKESELKVKIELKEAQPKIESFDTFIGSEGLTDMAQTAKLLGTGRTRLFKFLREQKLLKANNEPYQMYKDNGYFDMKKTVKNDRNYTVTLVTTKGIDYIRKIINNPTYPMQTSF